MPRAIARYLQTRTLAGPWQLEGDTAPAAAAVVIPALAEQANLFTTLASLADNPPADLTRTLIVVVVNHRGDARDIDRRDNLATLGLLRSGSAPSGLRLAWLDAASPGRELPLDHGGVGMARKLGFDAALARLQPGPESFIAGLDADTLVRPDYLPALRAHFATAAAEAATVPYCHQPGATPQQAAAIERYELYLRHYLLGLQLAGSPYAYDSIGSALAFRPAVYARAGGMNRRRAGEDFYLLQQLAKTGGVVQLRGTVVYPSARASHRVPFGTGEKIARLQDGEAQAVRFFPAECFRVLQGWLQLTAAHADEGGEALLARLREISPTAADFLAGSGFAGAWQRIRANHRDPARRRHAFHGWFDALATLRLLHALCLGPHPWLEAPRLTPLLRWAGLTDVENSGKLLKLLRNEQTGEADVEQRQPHFSTDLASDT